MLFVIDRAVYLKKHGMQVEALVSNTFDVLSVPKDVYVWRRKTRMLLQLAQATLVDTYVCTMIQQ